MDSGPAPKRAHPGMTAVGEVAGSSPATTKAWRAIRASRRSRTCECIPIPGPCPRSYDRRVLSGEGRFMRRSEVGQSESWPEGQPEGRCGARGCASQAWTRGALGNRPCPIRGAAFSGWTGQAKGGRKPAWMASLLAPALGRTGPRDEEVAARERRKAFRGLCFPKAGNMLR